ncbi:hypothetical protein LTS18_006411 [Coniosporium uncinatum]|uniref:Uncharacterized protein n=1 Tax=Coniosporium uncinatum TaxID=93489 RepID=A0ACC3DCD6_9PEZI|nr:hypothetical protein LTS18_006411 [Coniosporium uncinatum]
MKLSQVLSLLSLTSISLAQTNFTGDVISGYPVITSLDLSDVPSNTVSRYWIVAAVQQGSIPIYLPILVARGSNSSLTSGRKLSLSASIHGDELNGIPVVQRVFRQLNTTISSGDFNGTVIGIPTMNPNGNQHNQRNYWTSTGNGFYTNLNRIFPGQSIADGGSITDNYASTIWNSVWGNLSNVDVAVDLHTLSTGSIGPLWAYADYRLPYVQRLAELAQPDIIKIDPGEPGSVETTFVDNDVPAITLEIGPAKNWNATLIDRAEAFVYRLMEDLQMMTSPSSGSSNGTGVVQIDLSNTYRATNFSSVTATRTGWVQPSVGVLEDVTEGQEVGTVYNSWGDVVETLTAPVTGRVLQVRYDPAIEMGAQVLDIAYNATESG